MRVNVDENGKLEPIIVMATSTEMSLAPKQDAQQNVKKSVIDDAPLLKANNLQVVKMVNGAPAGVEANVHISLIEQPAGGIEFMKLYRLSGKISINHWAIDNLGCTIEAQSLVPLKGNAGQ